MANSFSIDYSRRDLTKLPPLPSSLKELFCEVNDLTKLPSLPPSLEVLDCFDNHLTSLPSLPPSLEELHWIFL